MACLPVRDSLTMTVAEDQVDKTAMDILKLIADLRVYRGQLEEAIEALSTLARKRGQLRGRPPGGGSEKAQKRSPETRRRMAEAQKKRWAAYRKAKTKRPHAIR